MHIKGTNQEKEKVHLNKVQNKVACLHIKRMLVHKQNKRYHFKIRVTNIYNINIKSRIKDS